MSEDQSMPPVVDISEDEQPIVDSALTPESAEAVEAAEGNPLDDDVAAVVQPRLVVKRAGVETDHVYPFACPAVIGRFDPSVGPIDIDLGSIEEGSYVSRKHAKITEEDGVYTITDLGSSNGTYVAQDGEFQKVDAAPISSGDEIALGNARLVFYV